MLLFVPCRTAMRGKFPLNGTYFQSNEVFLVSSTLANPVMVCNPVLLWIPPAVYAALLWLKQVAAFMLVFAVLFHCIT